MKKRADSAPPGSGGDCKPSRGLLDELSALEAMLEQSDRVDEEVAHKEVAHKDAERANKDDQRE